LRAAPATSSAYLGQLASLPGGRSSARWPMLESIDTSDAPATSSALRAIARGLSDRRGQESRARSRPLRAALTGPWPAAPVRTASRCSRRLAG
jgi:hypothetical protein